MIVACPSYRRAGDVTTMRVFPEGVLVVPESQAAEYEAAGAPDGWTIRAIPDDQDGNIARKRNAILDMFEGEDVVMVDDDYTRMIRFRHGGMGMALAQHEVAFMLDEGYSLAYGLEAPLWGVNVNPDQRHYYEFRPFSTLAMILGPFMALTAFRPKNLRFDEALAPKEDYDFCLHALRRFHCVPRLNMYGYVCDHVSKPGGIVSQRTMDSEREKGRLLQKRWGSRVVKLRFDWPKARGGGGAMAGAATTAHMDSQIRVPLSGV